jgi:hypothetical protein
VKTKKVIVAGPLVKVALYSRGCARDTPKARAAKRRLSSEAQKRMNAKYQKEKLELQLAANFLPRDHWVCFTFSAAHLPMDEKGVEACFKAFRRRYAKLCKGKTPVIIWRAEHKHESDDFRTDRRWHIHACIQARSGEDYVNILRSWPYGLVDIEPIRIDKNNSYAALAAYMTKEPLDRAGAHAWHSTRNAKRPEVESFAVPDDTPLQAPRGAAVCEEASDRNEYGSMHYIKYLVMSGLKRQRRPRAKRKR